jgi:hypothetical protein
MQARDPIKDTEAGTWKAAIPGIRALFQLVQWALLIGFLRYLGDHFNYQPPLAIAVLLSALLLAYLAISGVRVARRRSHRVVDAIALSALFAAFGFLLITCAWEVASLVSTLQASVVI